MPAVIAELDDKTIHSPADVTVTPVNTIDILNISTDSTENSPEAASRAINDETIIKDLTPMERLDVVKII